MKLLWLVALALISERAVAQLPAQDGFRPYGYRHTITGQFVPMYADAKDTSVVARRANQGEDFAVRSLGNTWAKVVYKGTKIYYVRKRYLNVPGAFVLTPEAAVFPRDSTTGLVRYVGEGTASGTQAELMARAQVWFASALRSKDVLQVQETAAGALVGKAYSEVFLKHFGAASKRLGYTIQLTCRDGRYQYVISSFEFQENYVSTVTADANSSAYQTINNIPAERLLSETNYNGQQSDLVMQYKSELYRVGRDLQSQLRTAMNKPIGL